MPRKPNTPAADAAHLAARKQASARNRRDASQPTPEQTDRKGLKEDIMRETSKPAPQQRTRKPRISKRPAEPVLHPVSPRKPRTRVAKMAAVSTVPGDATIAAIAAEAKVPVGDFTLYWAARKGYVPALNIVANMSPDQREKICPPGLRGNVRAVFVATGATLKAQLEQAQQARAAKEAAEEKRASRRTSRRAARTAAVTVTVENPTEVSNVTKPATTRTRKPAADKPVAPPARKADSNALTAADVARANNLDPRKFRAFLRSQNIARTFTTKASAAAAVKKFSSAAK